MDSVRVMLLTRDGTKTTRPEIKRPPRQAVSEIRKTALHFA
jgi:hypothetical protein